MASGKSAKRSKGSSSSDVNTSNKEGSVDCITSKTSKGVLKSSKAGAKSANIGTTSELGDSNTSKRGLKTSKGLKSPAKADQTMETNTITRKGTTFKSIQINYIEVTEGNNI